MLRFQLTIIASAIVCNHLVQASQQNPEENWSQHLQEDPSITASQVRQQQNPFLPELAESQRALPSNPQQQVQRWYPAINQQSADQPWQHIIDHQNMQIPTHVIHLPMNYAPLPVGAQHHQQSLQQRQQQPLQSIQQQMQEQDRINMEHLRANSRRNLAQQQQQQNANDFPRMQRNHENSLRPQQLEQAANYGQQPFMSLQQASHSALSDNQQIPPSQLHSRNSENLLGQLPLEQQQSYGNQQQFMSSQHMPHSAFTQNRPIPPSQSHFRNPSTFIEEPQNYGISDHNIGREQIAADEDDYPMFDDNYLNSFVDNIVGSEEEQSTSTKQITELLRPSAIHTPSSSLSTSLSTSQQKSTGPPIVNTPSAGLTPLIDSSYRNALMINKKQDASEKPAPNNMESEGLTFGSISSSLLKNLPPMGPRLSQPGSSPLADLAVQKEKDANLLPTESANKPLLITGKKPSTLENPLPPPQKQEQINVASHADSGKKAAASALKKETLHDVSMPNVPSGDDLSPPPPTRHRKLKSVQIQSERKSENSVHSASAPSHSDVNSHDFNVAPVVPSITASSHPIGHEAAPNVAPAKPSINAPRHPGGHMPVPNVTLVEPSIIHLPKQAENLKSNKFSGKNALEAGVSTGRKPMENRSTNDEINSDDNALTNEPGLNVAGSQADISTSKSKHNSKKGRKKKSKFDGEQDSEQQGISRVDLAAGKPKEASISSSASEKPITASKMPMIIEKSGPSSNKSKKGGRKQNVSNISSKTSEAKSQLVEKDHKISETSLTNTEVSTQESLSPSVDVVPNIEGQQGIKSTGIEQKSPDTDLPHRSQTSEHSKAESLVEMKKEKGKSPMKESKAKVEDANALIEKGGIKLSKKETKQEKLEQEEAALEKMIEAMDKQREAELKTAREKAELEEKMLNSQIMDAFNRGGKKNIDEILDAFLLLKPRSEADVLKIEQIRKQVHESQDKEMAKIEEKTAEEVVNLDKRLKAVDLKKKLKNKMGLMRTQRFHPEEAKAREQFVLSSVKDNIPVTGGMSSSSSAVVIGQDQQQQQQSAINHHEKIRNILFFLNNKKIVDLSNKKTHDEEDIKVMLFSIELFHKNLFIYWSENYGFHEDVKHAYIPDALAKIGLYFCKSGINRTIDQKMYESVEKSLDKTMKILAKEWKKNKNAIKSLKYKENEEYKFVSWMTSLDELTIELEILYERIKRYRNAFLPNSIEERRNYFDLKLETYFNEKLNERLRNVFGMLFIGIDQDKSLEMKKKYVLEGFYYLVLKLKWLPRYKDKLERGRKIMWNYFKIGRDILETKIRPHLSYYYAKSFGKVMPEGNYWKIEGKLPEEKYRHSQVAINEIDKFALSEGNKDDSKFSPKIIKALLELKDYIHCVYFMDKMSQKIKENKEKINLYLQEEKNAVWTIIEDQCNQKFTEYKNVEEEIFRVKFGHHFKLGVLQGAIDNVNEIKREKDFKDESIEARGDWETCKPMDGYEDFSAEKLESEKAEDIKESELEIEAEKIAVNAREIAKNAKMISTNQYKDKAKPDDDDDIKEKQKT